MGGRSGRATVTAAATVVVCLSLLLTGCGDSGDTGLADEVIPLPTEAPTNSTTSTSTTTTTVADFGFDHDLVQQVWHDYEAAVDAIETAVQDPPNGQPVLKAHLGGLLLDTGLAKLDEYTRDGKRVTYPDPRRGREWLHSIIELTPDSARLRVCAIDDSVLIDTASGQVLNDTQTLLRTDDTLTWNGSRWMLIARDGGKVEEAACPHAS